MSNNSITLYGNLNKARMDFQKKHENDIDNKLKDFLKGMTIQGFRGIEECHIDFHSPITAISGVNGSGKSTFLHLATCSYHDAGNSKRLSKYVSDYFPVISGVDEPITKKAEVEFFYSYDKNGLDETNLKYKNKNIHRVKYKNGKTGYYKYNADDKNKPEEGKRIYREEKVKVFRDTEDSRWRGYEKLPFRDIYFVGVSDFIPLAEEKQRRYKVKGKSTLSNDITNYISYIMGKNYNNSFTYNISKYKKNGKLIGLGTDSTEYTQANMGFGEGRISNIVYLFEESSPEQSLFILDEPEIALHGSAQERFTKYLMDVCTRRKHQIILTTHSRDILETLPSDSRVYLQRTSDGIKVISGIDSYSAVPTLHSKYTTSQKFVLCEDKTASEFIRHIFIEFERRILLSAFKIVPCGDKMSMLNASQILQSSHNTDMRVIHIPDGDMRKEFPDAVTKKMKEASTNKKINHNKYSRLNKGFDHDHLGNPVIYLPGDEAPEKVIISNDKNKTELPDELKPVYEKLISGQHVNSLDHHSYFREMANISDGTYAEEEIRIKFIKIYINSYKDECNKILNNIIQALDISG